jgi:hypothetical protein
MWSSIIRLKIDAVVIVSSFRARCAGWLAIFFLMDVSTWDFFAARDARRVFRTLEPFSINKDGNFCEEKFWEISKSNISAPKS